MEENLKCPNCGSKNIQKRNRGYSISLGIIFFILFGILGELIGGLFMGLSLSIFGLILGFVGKNKIVAQCFDCGKVYRIINKKTSDDIFGYIMYSFFIVVLIVLLIFILK